jgi:hypothetical protein
MFYISPLVRSYARVGEFEHRKFRESADVPRVRARVRSERRDRQGRQTGSETKRASECVQLTCQKAKKMTALTMKNLSTGRYGLRGAVREWMSVVSVPDAPVLACASAHRCTFVDVKEEGLRPKLKQTYLYTQ